MRNLFSWRLRPSEADFSKLWENATFVFDTNFLLDLYRVSRPTVEDFLKILEKLQNRIWLPYQVADEFLTRREEIIDSEAASFKKALSALEKWKSEQNKFNSLRGKLNEAGRIVAAEVDSLFDMQKNYLDAVDEVERVFREKINELANAHFPFDADNDSILESILSIFESKVGEPYDEQTLQSLYKEAEDRYKKLQPPGFGDVKDKGDERKYGDFILWKQILTFAQRGSVPIVFVTGEKKGDWWIKNNGEIVSPHIELRREFQEYVKQPFWIYRTQRFLEMAKDKLMVEINPRSIEETNAIADADLIDEQNDKVIEQAIGQTLISNSDALKELAGLQINYSDMQKAIGLSLNPNSAVLKELARLQINYSDMHKAIGQTLTLIPNSDALKKLAGLQINYSDMQKAIGLSLNPNLLMQKAIEQTLIPNSNALKELARLQMANSAATLKALKQIRIPEEKSE
ncbi:MAG: PIN domain-containing protein [Nostoc sp.]|uniref:PIN-like domain-containing protein n=1 Tax=Nostoc sp. TaxID=1180 RepID=UPI002FF524D9